MQYLKSTLFNLTAFQMVCALKKMFSILTCFNVVTNNIKLVALFVLLPITFPFMYDETMTFLYFKFHMCIEFKSTVFSFFPLCFHWLSKWCKSLCVCGGASVIRFGSKIWMWLILISIMYVLKCRKHRKENANCVTLVIMVTYQ